MQPLTAESIVQGRVVNASGEPAANVTIQVFSAVSRRSKKPPAGSVRTDERSWRVSTFWTDTRQLLSERNASALAHHRRRTNQYAIWQWDGDELVTKPSRDGNLHRSARARWWHRSDGLPAGHNGRCRGYHYRTAPRRELSRSRVAQVRDRSFLIRGEI